MEVQKAAQLEAVIEFIERHLDGKLELDAVAAAAHYSKYHLHHIFSETTGMTIHVYVSRRQLTQAAELLVFSKKPIIDIAFTCGYESQQAFTSAFKAMYKMPPAEYRNWGQFYPLQLRFCLHKETCSQVDLTPDHIRLAAQTDIPAWMELVRMAVDGYPHLDEADYLATLKDSIRNRQALILRLRNHAIGAMAFSYHTGSIAFMGVHPQYRSCGISKLFLDKLVHEYLPHREISTTTYRENDKADTGYRAELKRLGFTERELLTEFGYPTQRFVLPVPK